MKVSLIEDPYVKKQSVMFELSLPVETEVQIAMHGIFDIVLLPFIKITTLQEMQTNEPKKFLSNVVIVKGNGLYKKIQNILPQDLYEEIIYDLHKEVQNRIPDWYEGISEVILR